MIDEKRLETTPEQHIRNLMESIKDGMLTVTRYDPIEPAYEQTYTVSCTPKNIEEIISKYESLVQSLEVLGAVHDKLVNGEKARNLLTREQTIIWNSYICDIENEFDAGGYDIDEICSMKESGAPLSDEEQDILEHYYEWFEEQCFVFFEKKAYSPVHLVIRARRYEYLVACKAPKIIIEEEGRCLAEEMILYYYCI